MTEIQEFNRRRDDDVQRTLGRIESKLDAMVVSHRNMEETARVLDTRVTSLEVSRGWLIGAGAAAGGLIGWVASLFK
jgi:hypothetical protein